ncbi:MAG: hypothetical protein ACI814_000482 [Mariniblastus sp.]|jgi:hypothetical protein
MSPIPTDQTAEYMPIRVRKNLRKAPADAFHFADQGIVQSLENAVEKSESVDDLLSEIGHLTATQSECLGLWACQLDRDNNYGALHSLIQDEGPALMTVIEDQASEMIQRVTRTRQICSSPTSLKSPVELVVAPVCVNMESGSDSRAPLIILGCFRAENQSVLRLQWLMGLASQSIARWYQHRSLRQQQTESIGLRDSLGLVHTLNKTESISAATMAIANYLRRTTKAAQVAIMLSNDANRSQLSAISDVEQIDANSESYSITASACRQALVDSETLVYPSQSATGTPSQLALERYCKSNAFESCVNLPLLSLDGRNLGSILVAASSATIHQESFQQYLAHICSMTSGHLDVVIRANRGMTDIARQSWKKIRASNLTRFMVIACICFSVLMLVPLPYRISCNSELQPVLRRFIAAPYDGILQQSLVKSGDLVESNQIVAQLDGRQLRIELSALRAELDGAKKRRDSALAKGDIAISQIARSEMQRHEANAKILEERLGNLDVRSTIAGVVVSGDLEKAQGAPLEMGQTLFEIAPLDEMVAEIGIPESEIQYVTPGMPVAIKLDAFPFKTWHGTVEQIHPRTEIVGDQSVFIAEVKIPNYDSQLRPGMKGSAKIKTETASLGWSLFHRPLESLRCWMIW